jgi:nicotinamidase-related amidase
MAILPPIVRPEPKDTALLIVDMQEKLLRAMPDGPREQMVRNAGILIEAARRLNLPILASEQYPKGLGHTLPEIRELLGDVEPVEKMAFSCLGEEAFCRRLEETGRRTFLLTGVENHVCVLQTALDLVAAGRNVLLARDATCSRTKANWKTGCEVMAAGGVQVSSTETLVFQLLREAGTEAFKALSKLIR